MRTGEYAALAYRNQRRLRAKYYARRGMEQPTEAAPDGSVVTLKGQVTRTGRFWTDNTPLRDAIHQIMEVQGLQPLREACVRLKYVKKDHGSADVDRLLRQVGLRDRINGEGIQRRIRSDLAIDVARALGLNISFGDDFELVEG